MLGDGVTSPAPGRQHMQYDYQDAESGGGCDLWLGVTDSVPGFLLMLRGAAGPRSSGFSVACRAQGAVAAWALQKAHLLARSPAPSFPAQTPGLVPWAAEHPPPGRTASDGCSCGP